jgi:hypothetical protein
MQGADMHGGAAYRRPEHGELLAEHFKKRAGIGRKTSLRAQPAQKLGLAISKREIESLGHISPDVSQGKSAITRGLPSNNFLDQSLSLLAPKRPGVTRRTKSVLGHPSEPS